jgi:hypothetical protein
MPGMLNANDKWRVHIVYPSLEDGAADDDPTAGPEPEQVEEVWHPGRKPLLVMEHGSGGQNFLRYDHILRPLALQGIIAVSIEGGGGDNPPRRAARILCTARWFAALWPERNERLNCDLGFMGHSAGGQGAVVAARLRSMYPADVTHFFDLRALVSIAPRGAGAGQFSPEQTAPYLIIQGSTDEQVPDGGIRLFDGVSPEGSDEPNFGKSLVWAYDVTHGGFGGGQIESEKGRTLAAEYIVNFLRWRILNEFAEQFRPFFSGEAIPAIFAAHPEWWDYLPDYEGTPLILTAFTVDERRDGEVRRLIDTFDRDAPGQLTTAKPSEALVTAQPPFFSDRVVVGPAFPLANAANPDNQVARVDWSLEDPEPGRLSWTFDPGLALNGFSFLSLRVSNVLTIPTSANCSPIEPDDPVQFTITIRDLDDNEATVLTDVIIPQDFKVVGGDLGCTYVHFFRTLRIPLNDFCGITPLDLGAIRSMTFSFGFGTGGTPSGAVMLDGIEFTRSEFDDGAASSCM